jgi:hypothetical protein
MPNLALVLPQRNAHAVIFAHPKNDVCNVKLIILVPHGLVQMLHPLPQQDLVLLHLVVLLMLVVVVNLPTIGIRLLAKTKADQRVSQLRYPQRVKQRLLVNQVLHLLLVKQHLLVQKAL